MMRAVLLGAPCITLWCLASITSPHAQGTRNQQLLDPTALSGVVVAKGVPNVPIRQATVTAQSSTGRRWSAMSGDDGVFRIADLPAGEYVLSASKPAYLTSTYGAIEAAGAGTRIRLPRRAPTAPVRLQLVRGGVIAGTARGTDGEPAPDVVVTVFGASGPQRQAWTNFRGEYRIYGLPADTYTVSAKPESSLSPRQMGLSGALSLVTMPPSELDRRLNELARRTSSIAPGSARPTTAAAATPSTQSMELVAGLPEVYYPGGVTLGEGEQLTNIDLMLSLAGGASVNASVFDEQGRPATAARVTARALPRASSSQIYGGDGTRGEFRIVNMVPGRYLVEAVVLGAVGTANAGVRSAWANTVIDVGAGGAAKVTLALQPAMSMTGRVVTDPSGGVSRPAAGTRVSLTEASTSSFLRTPRSASLRADGTFQIDGVLPGSYTLSIANIGSAWIRSALAGGRDLMDAPIEFDGSSRSLSGVVVTLSNRHTAIAGTLRQRGGEGVSDLWVVIFPVDRNLWAIDSRRVRSMRPSTDGTFAFRDVPPGDYFLAALTTLKPTGWATPEFLDQVIPGAVRLSVAEGEQVNQDLAVAMPAQP